MWNLWYTHFFRFHMFNSFGLYTNLTIMRIKGISVHKALTWWGGVGGGLGMVYVFSLTFQVKRLAAALSLRQNFPL